MSHAEHHITPKPLLIKVFGALIFLTVFTVLTAQLDLGPFNVPLALLIAATKASLVVFVFMALKWDNRVNLLVFALGSIFVIVFLVFTLLDTNFRGDLPNTTKGTIQDQVREEQTLEGREPDPESLRFNREIDPGQ